MKRITILNWLNHWYQSLHWYQSWPKSLVIKIYKILIVCLTLLSFIIPSNSLWFILSTSIVTGSIYCLLLETQPQIIWLLSIIVKYYVNKVQSNFNIFLNLLHIKSTNIPYPRLKLNKNFNFLTYYDDENHHKKYILLFNRKLKSNDLIIFKDEFDQDITDTIEPYLGPMQNFHGIPLTPADFNHKKITIFRDGNISLLKTFDEFEPLIMV